MRKVRALKYKIIVNDPIHEVMDFGSDTKFRDTMKLVIDSVEFQRLRRISQLGLASFVFPGATHTRFSHALGAAYLANTVLEHLIEQEVEFERDVSKYKQSVIISTLLHDIGHGPFSHSFEKVLKELFKKKLSIDIPMHEDWTHEIICNSKSSIRKSLLSAGLNPKLVASPFEESSKVNYPAFLKQIVSSQIDVDRMDYLVRDSHFAGVSIGKIDLHYLINCLHIIRHSKNKPLSLGITTKGVKTYEAYAIARQMMNRSVYFHQKVKVSEFMAETIFRELITGYTKLSGLKYMNNLIPKYFMELHEVFKNPKKYEKNKFIENNFLNYTALSEDNFWTIVKALSGRTDRIGTLSSRILRRDILPSFLIKHGKEQITEEALNSKGLVSDRDYSIVDLKTTLYEDLSEKEKVFVLDPSSQQVNEVSKHSQLISSFKDKPEVEKLLIVNNDRKLEKIRLLLLSIGSI